MRCQLSLRVALPTLAFVTCWAMGEGATTRPAPPDPTAVRNAAADIDQIYHNELARDRQPEEKAAMAGTLLKAAAEEHEAATKLALLNKVVDLAVEAGDIETTAAALDRIDGTWEIDSSKSRTKAFSDLSRHVRAAAGQTSLAHRLEAEAVEAAAAGRYDVAREAIEAAVDCARRGNDPGLVDELSTQAADITRAQAAWERVEPSLDTLKSKPHDPAANLIAGKFECFWGSGLPKLARGSDPKLKSLADKDLADAPGPEDQVATADAWWEWSKREDERVRRQIQAHAAELYRRALPKLGGLTRLHVQQRVDAAARQPSAAATAPASGEVKLLNLTNAREAGQILADVLHDYPDSLKDVKRATLAWYHNGSEYQHGGGGSKRLPGAFSPSPLIADSRTFLFWGVNDAYKPGKYLIVSRFQSLSPIGTGAVAEMDMYTKEGQGLTGHHLEAKELRPGQWSAVPMVITLAGPEKVDCRMYTKEQHTMALDRVYVFQLR